MNRSISTPEEILKLRTRELRVHAGPGAEVRVQQLRHLFSFGTPTSSARLDENARGPGAAWYRGMIQTYFNTVVSGNALKWATVEAERGVEDYAEVDRLLDWADAHDYYRRGHCAFYAADIHVQPWVRDISDDYELRGVIEHRARSLARRYAGRIPEYDLNNEILDGCWYSARLGEGIIKDMAEWMLEEAPGTLLYLNEHDILTGGDVDRYVEQIERLLELGVPIGGIGCQGHLDMPLDLSHVGEALDKLAVFGLPIKITEFDIGPPLKLEALRGVSWIRGAWKLKNLPEYRRIMSEYGEEYEQEKALGLRNFYEICFAHPAVQAIIMWSFTHKHWRGKGGLFKEDGSPLPSGREYCDLVRKRWWTDVSGGADENGRYGLRAFHGRYRVESRGQTREFTLYPGESPLEISL